AQGYLIELVFSRSKPQIRLNSWIPGAQVENPDGCIPLYSLCVANFLVVNERHACSQREQSAVRAECQRRHPAFVLAKCKRSLRGSFGAEFCQDKEMILIARCKPPVAQAERG